MSSGFDVGSFFTASFTSLKASEMYFRNNSPRTTCLYSAASMLLRNLSAAFQSLSSKPRFAPFELGCRSGGVLPDKVSLSVIGEYGNSVFIGINLLPLFLIGSRKRRVL